MGGRSFQSGAFHAARRIVVLANIVALLLAPIIVSLTHAAVAGEAAAFSALDMSGEIDTHGHAHDDAPADGNDVPVAGHDGSDHEHQLQALVGQAASAHHVFPVTGPGISVDALRQLNPDGPKRPPRVV